MRKLLKAKLNKKKGFTLAELLIVVAIIAVLVAIAVPIFSAQLDNARKQVDAANMRSAASMATTEFMSSERKAESTYYFNQATDGTGAMTISMTANTDPKKPPTLNNTGTIRGRSTDNANKTIKIVLDAKGNIDSAIWE